jgi:thioredoxin reductase
VAAQDGQPEQAVERQQTPAEEAEDLDLAGRSVVVATGARYGKLAVPRLEELEGISVHYAATHVEAQTCRRDPVAVVGGGNSAGQAAVFLCRDAARVSLLVRGGDLAESMSRYLADRIERSAGIEVLLHTTRAGSETSSRWTIEASSSPAPRPAGTPVASRCCWRPASPACSPSATFAADPSSG